MSEQSAVIAEEKKVLIDNDTFRKLHAGEVKLDDLNVDQKAEFHERFVVKGEEVPTKEEEEAVKEPIKTVNAELKTETLEEEKDLDPEEQERRRKYKELRDSNNTLQQKLKSASERLENLQKMRIETPPKLEIDEYDDNAKKQAQFNQGVADKVNTWVNSESAAIQTEKAQLQQETLYSSVGAFQAETPELATSKSIKTLDAAFVRFRDTLVPGNDNEAKNKAVQEFLSNPEARKQQESKGILFPFSDADWKRYQTISAVHSFKANGGDPNWDSAKRGDKYPDLDVAYYAYKKQTGFVPDSIRNTAIETQRKVVEQISNSQSQTTLLSPNDGRASSTVDGMTESQAEQWLISHPTPSTPEDVKTLKMIMTKFSTR